MEQPLSTFRPKSFFPSILQHLEMSSCAQIFTLHLGKMVCLLSHNCIEKDYSIYNVDKGPLCRLQSCSHQRHFSSSSSTQNGENQDTVGVSTSGSKPGLIFWEGQISHSLKGWVLENGYGTQREKLPTTLYAQPQKFIWGLKYPNRALSIPQGRTNCTFIWGFYIPQNQYFVGYLNSHFVKILLKFLMRCFSRNQLTCQDLVMSKNDKRRLECGLWSSFSKVKLLMYGLIFCPIKRVGITLVSLVYRHSRNYFSKHFLGVW